MRASTVFVTLALAATAMADSYYPTAPITTGISTPSGMPVPPTNGTTNGTHNPTPPDQGAGSSISPASMLGLVVAGVAIVVGGVAF